MPMNAHTVRLHACLLFALGLAATASAEPIVGLTTTNRLVTFDSAAPGTVAPSIAVTGLQVGETLLGIDYRPATQTLYGLGSTSRLYSLDATTGAATQVGSAGAVHVERHRVRLRFQPHRGRIRVVGNTGRTAPESQRRNADCHRHRAGLRPPRRQRGGHAANRRLGVHQQLRRRRDDDALRHRLQPRHPRPSRTRRTAAC
jgi:hypothetical protein